MLMHTNILQLSYYFKLYNITKYLPNIICAYKNIPTKYNFLNELKNVKKIHLTNELDYNPSILKATVITKIKKDKLIINFDKIINIFNRKNLDLIPSQINGYICFGMIK